MRPGFLGSPLLKIGPKEASPVLLYSLTYQSRSTPPHAACRKRLNIRSADPALLQGIYL